MPFCKVPATPLIYGRHQNVASAASSTSTSNSSTTTKITKSSEATADWNGPRRVRAPLRHSVDGGPTSTMTPSGSSSRLGARPHFRSSYADPAVANGADPYVKWTTSRDIAGNGFIGRKKSVAASTMTSALRPEVVRKSDVTLESDSGRPASTGSNVVRHIACQIELLRSSDTSQVSSRNDVDRNSRGQPEVISEAVEAMSDDLRDAIYKSSRAGWSRQQTAARHFWSQCGAPADKEPHQSPPQQQREQLATISQHPNETGSGTGNSDVVVGVVGESLIAREIREQHRREDELNRQRRIVMSGDVIGDDVKTTNGTAAAGVDDVDGSVCSRSDVISPAPGGRGLMTADWRSRLLTTERDTVEELRSTDSQSTAQRDLLNSSVRRQPLQPQPLQPHHLQPHPLQPQHPQPQPLQRQPPQSQPLQPHPLQPRPPQHHPLQPQPLQPHHLQPHPLQPQSPQPQPLQPLDRRSHQIVAFREELGTSDANRRSSVTVNVAHGRPENNARCGLATSSPLVTCSPQSGAQSKLRKLANSRMLSELEQDQQREQELRGEKPWCHLPVIMETAGGYTEDRSSGTTNLSYGNRTLRRTNRKQISFGITSTVTFDDDVKVVKPTTVTWQQRAMQQTIAQPRPPLACTLGAFSLDHVTMCITDT